MVDIVGIGASSLPEVLKADILGIEYAIIHRAGILSRTKLENIASLADIKPVFNGLAAQGTSDSTTTILDYGINIFTTVTASNYASKLPQPKTGKSLKIINKGAVALFLFPSNTGGQINNLPIDAPAIIPNDGNIYEFTCIENPLPGMWTWSTPATSQVVIPDISITHTNGTATTATGIDGLSTSTPSVGSNGLGQIVLGGAIWGTELVNKNISKIKVYTNALPADVGVPNAAYPNTAYPNTIYLNIKTGYLTAPNSATSGSRLELSLYDNTPIGTPEDFVLSSSSGLNSPLQIGDNGTAFWEIDMLGGGPFLESLKIGTGQYSSHYYTFYFLIPATAVTKTYKFRIIFETY